jgi:D-serine dehydratase
MAAPELSSPLADWLERALDEPVDWRYKGMPPTSGALTLRSLGDQGWNVLARDLMFPLMVLKERALAHNVGELARFASDHGAQLAPHGKTYMSPQIFKRQLDAGAWGITAATISQMRAYRAFGVERVLLANELVDPVGLRWVASELDADERFSFYCLVDSERGVELMDEALAAVAPRRRLAVLVELGWPGTRAGCRTDDEALAVVAAVKRSAHLELAGVEGYEGVIGHSRDDEVLAAVDEFLGRIREFVTELDRRGAFEERDEILVTAGGSAYFDQVVDQLALGSTLSRPVRLVVRSGGYATHDAGLYERLSPLRSGVADDPLQQALELWGEVLSRPEPDLAIVGFGKRDAPHDVDLPMPRRIVRASGEQVAVDGQLEVFELMDQHAFARVKGVHIDVGDLVVCGISHPCTAFDKWRLIPTVDDDYGVTGAIRTYF